MSYTPRFTEDDFRSYPNHFYLPNEDGKTVFYTYIRKNACSTFKVVMLEHLKKVHAGDQSTAGNIRRFIAPHEPVPCDHTLFIYRDPFDRALSAYVNKFVDRRGAQDIAASYATITGRDPNTASFRDFVDYIRQGPFSRLDPHVWPQKSHLASIAYTDPVPLGRLNQWIARTLPSLKPIFEHPANVSRIEAGEAPDLVDIPANVLALATRAVRKDSFKSLRPSLEEIYSADVAMISELTEASLDTAAGP